MTLKDIHAHILNYLYSRRKPVTVGNIKHKLLGSGIRYEDLFNSLFEMNLIGIQGNNVSLSKEGETLMAEQEEKETQLIHRLVFEREFDLALLEFLVYREVLVHLDDFPKVLKEHAPAYGTMINDGPVQQALFELEKTGYVENPVSQWYGITFSGRAFYRHAIGKFEKSIGTGQEINKKAGSEFTTGDKAQMNQKLDQILEELSKVHTSSEVIWTDMKADFEELKNLYGLSKKNWRQLLIGKIAEWTAGGIVSESVSKGIVDFVKTTARELAG